MRTLFLSLSNGFVHCLGLSSNCRTEVKLLISIFSLQTEPIANKLRRNIRHCLTLVRGETGMVKYQPLSRASRRSILSI